ncbi:hypothetical protein [Siphonobacter aquaeclarae]|uniref:HEAT repeat-containing protein n=1 Tax=Siphonobacter aquaeclarae TaxID=563176 RepID=A0A1G9VN06_9BACT|nr:hypothetical protein [Siphonobacter aquaeclarae]SDM73453.1 hypothetical protein SAMN04488090_4170 [Siphonobacter aquaeclarae]
MKKYVAAWLWMVSSGMLAAFPKSDPPGKVKAFSFRENDTTAYVLNLAYDAAGQPSYFYRNIFTPVCYTGECKPVYVNFYWDLLGNYIRYDLPEGKTLTKMDHKEFDEANYDKLQQILSDPESLLKDVTIYDLIGPDTDKLRDSVDAKTGATLKTIKNEVIEGAVYTCYTLWHIAYGKGCGEMKRLTDSLMTDDLLHAFLQSQNFHYQYFAMEKVVGNPAFLNDWLTVIRGKNPFVARAALQKLDPQVFASDDRQVWLWETYRRAGYTLQLAILKKLETIPVRPALAGTLAEALPAANAEQTGYFLGILRKGKPSVAVARKLAATLATATPGQGEEVYRLLDSWKLADRAVRDQLKKWKQTHE